MNARASGDCLEYYLALFLSLSGAKPKNETTKTRLSKLLGSFDSKNELSIAKRIVLNKKLDRVIKSYSNKKMTEYTLNSDNAGKTGVVSDVIVHFEDGSSLPISCKRNNISFKHQRLTSFAKQCNINEIEYKTSYKNLNDKWYNDIKHHNQFCRMTEDEKMVMYSEFNMFIERYLRELTVDQVSTWYNFIMSIERKIILHWDDKTNTFTVYDYINKPIPQAITSLNVTNNYLQVAFDNGVELSLRLHTASKSISKTLSLKYDTKVVNISSLCNTITF